MQSPAGPKRPSTASRAKSKPGAPAKKPMLKKDKKNLERVLSTERMRRSVSRGPTDAIALMRSASATTIPGLKRETSDHSLLGMISRKPSGPLTEKSTARPTSNSSADGEKARKKAVLDAELKDAITALKKPNRALAGKEIVEAAEKRTSSLSQLKKARKPTRVSTAPAVQVKATPANNRFRDAVAAGSRDPGFPHEAVGDDPDIIPPSSAMVPSSTAAKRIGSRLFESSVVASTPVPAKAARTTSAAPLGPTPIRLAQIPEQSPSVPQSSPVLARKAAPRVSGNKNLTAQAPTPHAGPGTNAPAAASSSTPFSFRPPTLFETPVRSRSAGRNAAEAEALNDTPTVKPLCLSRGGKNRQGGTSAGTTGATKQMTIYQQLGWDDGDQF